MTLRVTVVDGLMAENPSLPYPKETTRTIPHPCRKPDHDSSSLGKVHQPRTILTIISVEAQVIPNKVTDNRNLDTDNNLLLNLLWTRMDILQIWNMVFKRRLTLREGLQLLTVAHVEGLEVLQLPKAFGQQTGEQLDCKLESSSLIPPTGV